MRQFFMPRFLLPILALTACMAANATAKPFTPDAHTLFLAHFEELRRAEYAQGISAFAGNGARAAEGYYGRGIDLRVRGLTPDFINSCSDYTPRYDGWGFHPRGNINPYEGTFECWFKPADPAAPKLLWSANFLNAELGRNVKHPTSENYVGFGITLNAAAIRYTIPTLGGKCFIGDVAFRAVPGYQKALDPKNWHHFALTWSQGEAVIWLDGRVLVTFDMADQHGLAIMANPVRYLSMSDCIIDELRISCVVRYLNDFEPGWRDGKRPAHAFTGNAATKRYEQRLIDMPAPASMERTAGAETVSWESANAALRFDSRTGRLASLRLDGVAAPDSAEGLLLYRGLERHPLAPVALRDWRVVDGVARFEQIFEGDALAAHAIESNGGAVVWSVTLTNLGKEPLWLEPLLSLPVPVEKVDEFFDGCEPRRTIAWPRHRDEYASTLPFAAAAGDGRYMGVGIEPRIDLSDIVSQWIPAGSGGIVRQGTKVALDPNESFTYRFHIVHGAGDFGTLDAVSAFHARFPDLYHLRPDVPVYSYMPATQQSETDDYPDMKRFGYAGGFWGHGPGHDKGDEYGNPRWWNNPKLDAHRHYANYTRRIERLWGTIANLHEVRPYYYRQGFDNFYPVRRFHTCPDVTATYIVEQLWPGYEPNDDPLCFGQYYRSALPTFQALIINEYNTPIGDFFREQTRRYFGDISAWSPGYINDMSHAGSLYRHNDPIAQKTPGRSFSRDLGPFVRKAIGRKQRYEVLNNWVVDGNRATFWSDGGSFSYTLGAYSAGMAIEGAGVYKDLTGPTGYVAPGRFLNGEKPFTAMTHLNDDWIGYYLKPGDFTPETLRDYYRFCDAQLSLYCIDQGIALDPTSYMWGRQEMWERQPIMVESIVPGRKIVPGARVSEPLWVRRAGDGMNAFFVIGNYQPAAAQTDMEILGRYFDGALLVAEYYGGRTAHAIAPAGSTLGGIAVEPRGVAAFKAVALLRNSGAGRVVTQLSGDGITMRLEMELDVPKGAELRLSEFAPVYEIASLKIDDRAVHYRSGEPIVLPGPCRLTAEYRARSLPFTAQDWQAVELVKDGRTNFCLVADGGVSYRTPVGGPSFRIGFERGTAIMLNEFIAQYDQEDGVVGNLKAAPIVQKRPENDPGWAVVLVEDRVTRPGIARINVAQREVRIEGATQGEMRRAMVMFMRMVDRKYPRVGRFFPLTNRKGNYDAAKPVPFEKWVVRKPTREFYEQFSDPLFLVKPVLRREYESLYTDNAVDFTGRYAMRWSPYLYEPTYGSDFVYGYSGPGFAFTREELHRQADETKGK